uniref:Retrotransposon gag domain-containing protein n=1 Tax=Strigamia maritima TaxID=126957 RepID=T1IQ83_STRMM
MTTTTLPTYTIASSLAPPSLMSTRQSIRTINEGIMSEVLRTKMNITYQEPKTKEKLSLTTPSLQRGVAPAYDFLGQYRLKVEKISYFDPDKSEFDTVDLFLGRLYAHYYTTRIPVREYLKIYVVQALRGKAQRWWMAQKPKPATWEEFEKIFRQMFSINAAAATVKLAQKKPHASKPTSNFLSEIIYYLEITRIKDKELQWQTAQNKLQTEVVQIARAWGINSIDEAMKMGGKMDERLQLDALRSYEYKLISIPDQRMPLPSGIGQPTVLAATAPVEKPPVVKEEVKKSKSAFFPRTKRFTKAKEALATLLQAFEAEPNPESDTSSSSDDDVLPDVAPAANKPSAIIQTVESAENTPHTCPTHVVTFQPSPSPPTNVTVHLMARGERRRRTDGS